MMRFGAPEAQAVTASAATTPGAQARRRPPTARASRRPPTARPADRRRSVRSRVARVGLALDRSGFTVVDRDRSTGIYFVRYATPIRT